MSEQLSTQRDRLWIRCLAVYCIALFLILLGFLLAEYYLEEPAIELSAYGAASQEAAFLVGINSASIEELQTLPRIGPVLAQSIIDYRTQYGRFHSVEQLLEVPGIGEKTLELIRPLVSLD